VRAVGNLPTPDITRVKRVEVYTDGSCSGNPGPGGWAAVLRYAGPEGVVEKVLTGAERETTNNRMELTAVVEALAALNERCEVALHSDSAYIVNALNDGWLDNWQRRGWRTGDRKPVKNRDLWERLEAQRRRHSIRFVKVKGHAEDEMNNRVDRLAVAAMRSQTPG
jgi:ribonuclease HI